MASVIHQLGAADRVDRATLGRTFAMTLVGSGCLAIAAGVLTLLVLFGPAALADPETAPMIFIFGLFATVAAALGGGALAWAGARRRAWFWLLPTTFGLLVFVLNFGHITYDLARPANTSGFLITLLVTPGTLAAISGGITAFREVRRGSPTWRRSGRAGLISLAVLAAIVGAAATSALAGLASAGGAAVAVSPDATAVLTVNGMAFTETDLQVTNGEVLGLFVTNDDAIGHSFDIDSLDIHVELPPNSTQAVAIEPTGPGTLEFYCGVPGHRAAGMVGTISVQ